jgi:hypothetical protein
MSRSAIPGWWMTLTKTQADQLDLLDAVERAGVAKNDRTAVERIWQARRIAKARRRVVQRMIERDDGA